MGSERSAPWGGARPTSPTPPFSPLSKVTARRLLRYTQEWRPSGTALLTAVAFATLLLLNVEASFSLSALSKGWKRDDVNGGKADAFTLTQVRGLGQV